MSRIITSMDCFIAESCLLDDSNDMTNELFLDHGIT